MKLINRYIAFVSGSITQLFWLLLLKCVSVGLLYTAVLFLFACPFTWTLSLSSQFSSLISLSFVLPLSISSQHSSCATPLISCQSLLSVLLWASFNDWVSLAFCPKRHWLGHTQNIYCKIKVLCVSVELSVQLWKKAALWKDVCKTCLLNTVCYHQSLH